MEFWSDGAKTLTNQNPKSEARNPKQAELLKFESKSEIPNELVWNFVL